MRLRCRLGLHRWAEKLRVTHGTGRYPYRIPLLVYRECLGCGKRSLEDNSPRLHTVDPVASSVSSRTSAQTIHPSRSMSA